MIFSWGKKMTEQVIETDSTVVEGSGAVQVWCT